MNPGLVATLICDVWQAPFSLVSAKQKHSLASEMRKKLGYILAGTVIAVRARKEIMNVNILAASWALLRLALAMHLNRGWANLDSECASFVSAYA